MSNPIRDRVREFALGLPEAYEDFPWGDTVIKVNKKIFVFLGDSGYGVKLRESHGHAMSLPGTEPSRYGLGKAGWVSVTFGDVPDVEVLCDWVEESYRSVAPKRLVKLLETP
jgi:predicted DNA-binding protein (MmcQ/YjbR family)